jgi:hypothetical protein
MKAALLLTILLFVTACSSGISPEEIEAKVIEANSNIDSYKVISHIDIMTQTEENSFDMSMEMTGEIDRTTEKGHLVSTTSMNLLGTENSFEQESYIDGDIIYSEIMGNWVKINIKNSWEDQDQAAQYAELIKNGDIKIKGKETVEGTEYYLAEMSLDQEFLNQYLMSSGQELSDLKFTDYDIIFYVNTKTFVIERNLGTLTVNDDVEGESISMNMEIDTKIYDINEPISITIPETATNAEELTI